MPKTGRSHYVEGAPSAALQMGIPAPTSRRRLLAAVTVPTIAALPFRSADPRTTTPPQASPYNGRPNVRRARSQVWLADFDQQWGEFLRRYVVADGRVVDTRNAGISHSEGQGSALLFAAEAGDLPNFNRILEWTRSNLRCRGDRLHAWRYRHSAMTPISDLNNATDGDILIAWALQRAAQRFARPEFATEAAWIARDVLVLCTRRVDQRVFLLPGADGFERRDHLILNPSYYLFPALADLKDLVPSDRWRQLISDGLETCCRSASFGRWSLPADWIEVPHDPTSPPRIALGRPARFSWDALRVPLALAWGRQRGEPMLHSIAAFWNDHSHLGGMPAWVDLRNDGLAPYPAHAGGQAVALLVKAVCSQTQRLPTSIPGVSDADDYYGASLTLMARIAWNDGEDEMSSPPST